MKGKNLLFGFVPKVSKDQDLWIERVRWPQQSFLFQCSPARTWDSRTSKERSLRSIGQAFLSSLTVTCTICCEIHNLFPGAFLAQIPSSSTEFYPKASDWKFSIHLITDFLKGRNSYTKIKELLKKKSEAFSLASFSRCICSEMCFLFWACTQQPSTTVHLGMGNSSHSMCLRAEAAAQCQAAKCLFVGTLQAKPIGYLEPKQQWKQL